ncbi:MAG TPA: polyphosphate kinase 2 [Devosia sp.]|nr:polyphosphate kinase 2 [Devosia sp.]
MNENLPPFDIENPRLPKWLKKAALGSGGYPYDKRLDDDEYLKRLLPLQLELVKLQTHLIKTAGRMIVIFEGRDAAGKGGAIDAFREHLNGRYWLDVALPKPSDRERTQWYFQRYVDWLPAAGEAALFDRSWYNRAGIEPVMGFCTPEQTEAFLDEAPRFERMLVRDGIHLFKFWLAIGKEMQLKRFHSRRHDPLKQWKISEIDIAAIGKWDSYTDAAHRMLHATHTPETPWRVVLANDKLRARLEMIRAILEAMDYEGRDEPALGEVDEKIVIEPERFIREHSQS